jgi:hypothetical protein
MPYKGRGHEQFDSGEFVVESLGSQSLEEGKRKGFSSSLLPSFFQVQDTINQAKVSKQILLLR